MELIPMRGFELGRFPLQRQMNRLFEEFFGDAGWPTMFESGRGSVAIDLAESDEEYLLTAEIPGIDPKAVEISVTGNTLTLKAEKKQDSEKKVRNVHRSERIYGAFQRMIALPGDVDPNAVHASSRDGVLTVRLGKREESKPRSIAVKVE